MSEQPMRGRGAPDGAAPRSQAPQEPPDYLEYAGRQLGHVARAITRMVEQDPQAADSDKVIDLRLRLAAAYTDVASIQYSIPDEGDDFEGNR